MPAIVSLLRAVNVGGNNRIKMDVLRDLYTALKLRDVETYVQSGNVVFTSSEKDLSRLARRIEDAIEKRAGFRPAVVLRTAAEMAAVVTRNPFAGREGLEPGKLAVIFLDAEPAPDACARFFAVKKDSEELRISGREAYIYYPDGMGRSKVTANVVEKALGTRGTARNWNSVTKLLEMAAALEVK